MDARRTAARVLDGLPGWVTRCTSPSTQPTLLS
jgi:hypothetical protein